MENNFKSFLCLFILFFCLCSNSVFSMEPGNPQGFKKKTNEPIPMSVKTTTSITRSGITWTFQKPVQFGQFANGDYWAIDQGSGVTIVNIDPLSIESSGRIMHGSMLNPTTLRNGYDNTIAQIIYDPLLNVARPSGSNLSSTNPLIIKGNTSLVSTRTNTIPKSRPQLVDAAVLTILTDIPPSGCFRPPYSGNNKSLNWNVADIHWQILPQLSKKPLSVLPDLSKLTTNIERVWLDHGGGIWTGRYLHPSNNMPGYGRDMTIQTGDIALALLLDYSQADLETLMIRFLQLGIDWYGITEYRTNIFTTTTQGGLWMGGGGHGHGRKWPITFAGLMFNDSNILKYSNGVSYPIFQEEQQHFFVSQSDINQERYTADGRPREPYTTDMIGTPEWGGQHWMAPQRDGSNWTAYYRDIVSMSLPGHALSAILMNARTTWNWHSLFEYQDRWWNYRKSISKSGSYSAFVDDMWNTYRNP